MKPVRAPESGGRATRPPRRRKGHLFRPCRIDLRAPVGAWRPELVPLATRLATGTSLAEALGGEFHEMAKTRLVVHLCRASHQLIHSCSRDTRRGWDQRQSAYRGEERKGALPASRPHRVAPFRRVNAPATAAARAHLLREHFSVKGARWSKLSHPLIGVWEVLWEQWGSCCLHHHRGFSGSHLARITIGSQAGWMWSLRSAGQNPSGLLTSGQ